MSGSLRLSCVMPVWNGERYVGEALDSILGQSRPPDEIVVVDDGSTDGTPDVLAAYGDAVRVIRRPNGGYACALNVGISACLGDVVMFCDADDLVTPDAAALRLARLTHDDLPAAVFGLVEQFVSPELPPETAGRFRIVTGPVASPLLGSMIARRPLLDRVGPFDESLRAGASVAWIARAQSDGPIGPTIDAVVLRRRIHETNLSRGTGREGNRDLLAVVRAHHRRRSGSSR